ncbi:hypothetical protein Tco_1255788 [Tanacetum coccineum]
MNVSYFGRSIEYLEICLEHKFSTPFFLHLRKLKSQERGFYFNFKFGISGLLHQWSLQIADIKGGKDSQRELMSIKTIKGGGDIHLNAPTVHKTEHHTLLVLEKTKFSNRTRKSVLQLVAFGVLFQLRGGRDVRNSFSDDKRASSGKKCEKNYSSVRRYVADPVNVSPNGQPLSLLSKEQDLKWFATNSAVHLIILSLKESFETAQEMITQVYGLLSSCLVQYFSFKENEVFQDMQLIQKLRGDQKCMKKVVPSSRSKATKDIISIGSFVEVLVLNHYVLVRKILGKLSKLHDEVAQNKTNIQEPRKPW